MTLLSKAKRAFPVQSVGVVGLAAGSVLAFSASPARAAEFVPPDPIKAPLSFILSTCLEPGDCFLGDKTLWGLSVTGLSDSELSTVLGEINTLDGEVFNVLFDFTTLQGGGIGPNRTVTADYFFAVYPTETPKVINTVGVDTNISIAGGQSLTKEIFESSGLNGIGASLGTITSLNGNSDQITLTPGEKQLYIKDTLFTGSRGVFTGTNSYVQVPTDQVPGPLPLLGAAAAFGFSRKMRNRVKAAKAFSMG